MPDRLSVSSAERLSLPDRACPEPPKGMILYHPPRCQVLVVAADVDGGRAALDFLDPRAVGVKQVQGILGEVGEGGRVPVVFFRFLLPSCSSTDIVSATGFHNRLKGDANAKSDGSQAQ